MLSRFIPVSPNTQRHVAHLSETQRMNDTNLNATSYMGNSLSPMKRTGWLNQKGTQQMMYTYTPNDTYQNYQRIQQTTVNNVLPLPIKNRQLHAPLQKTPFTSLLQPCNLLQGASQYSNHPRPQGQGTSPVHNLKELTPTHLRSTGLGSPMQNYRLPLTGQPNPQEMTVTVLRKKSTMSETARIPVNIFGSSLQRATGTTRVREQVMSRTASNSNNVVRRNLGITRKKGSHSLGLNKDVHKRSRVLQVGRKNGHNSSRALLHRAEKDNQENESTSNYNKMITRIQKEDRSNSPTRVPSLEEDGQAGDRDSESDHTPVEEEKDVSPSKQREDDVSTHADETPSSKDRSQESEIQSSYTKEETLFILDWDDTFLPSNWMAENNLTLQESSYPSPEQVTLLNKLSDVLQKTLELCVAYGNVIFITNAEKGWIDQSCAKYMPKLYATVDKIRQMSARTTYEKVGVFIPLEWKLKAFRFQVNDHFGPSHSQGRKNIISIGDSSHEREALIRVTNSMNNVFPKSLKFVERPTVEEILKQHTLIQKCFAKILNHNGKLDLAIRSYLTENRCPNPDLEEGKPWYRKFSIGWQKPYMDLKMKIEKVVPQFHLTKKSHGHNKLKKHGTAPAVQSIKIERKASAPCNSMKSEREPTAPCIRLQRKPSAPCFSSRKDFPDYLIEREPLAVF